MCFTHELKSYIYFEFVYYLEGFLKLDVDSITINRGNWLVSQRIRALVLEGSEHYIKGINGQDFQLEFTRSQHMYEEIKDGTVAVWIPP